MKSLARGMEEADSSVIQLVAATGLDAKLVKAIVDGNYTPSPSQRQRLAAALGLSTDDISWGHAVPVQHLRGNGPQTGRKLNCNAELAADPMRRYRPITNLAAPPSAMQTNNDRSLVSRF
jgi:hypothetical protein